ncbi:MAG: urocanate hydratase [Theionarchaea archaeon]|nr:urocanate hydratase [Theionarchaea archaeon]
MYEKYKPKEPIKAYTGEDLRCKTWDAEAALRMMENNLTDLGTPRYRVAKDWKNLIVYGGSGRAARNWREYQRIRDALINLEPKETLCVQSGKAVYVAKTYKEAPRVIIANSNLVPRWATDAHFDHLDELGLMMYGQMTAGSWIYIGFQGILQGTYSTMYHAGRQAGGSHPNPLEGKFVLTAGLGAMGQAQPLAVTMNGGVGLIVEVKEEKIDNLLPAEDNPFPKLDEKADSLEDALERVVKYKKSKTAKSIGLVGNCGKTHPKLVEMAQNNFEYLPDFVTDQTSAHKLENYIPVEYNKEYQELIKTNPDLGKQEYEDKSQNTMITHMKALLQLKKMGSIIFEYGNGIRAKIEEARATGKDAPIIKEVQPVLDEYGDPVKKKGEILRRKQYVYPGFVRKYIRQLFCQGKGPFRWATLSGKEDDIFAIDKVVEKEFATDPELKRWTELAREYGSIFFQGLPSRVCWVAYGDRAKLGLKINEMVRDNEITGPIVIGRDHLDCGSVASPTRETEEMLDETDAVADWPLLNFALNAVCGASWVSFHSGGGVGHGLAMHAGMVIVADGTRERDKRLEHVLTVDPGIGVARHFDAGYKTAREVAEKKSVKIPAHLYTYE